MSDRGTERLARISDHLCCSNTDQQKPFLSPTSATSLQPVDSYGYVVENNLLTPDQVDFYNKNGYLVVRNLVGKIHLDRYYKRFQQICSGEVRVAGLDVMKDVTLRKSKSLEGEKVINKIQNYQYDDVLFEYCCLPGVLKYVECFTGPDIMAVHTMLINKPPDPGTQSSRHPLHQDLHYFPFRPANRYMYKIILIITFPKNLLHILHTASTTH